jgi:heme-degrading monooxygenase HmoA
LALGLNTLPPADACAAVDPAPGPTHRPIDFHPGFVSTTLMKDLRSSRRYVVADRWTSEKLYDEFKKKAEAAYDDLTARGHRLIDKEKELGRFDFVE